MRFLTGVAHIICEYTSIWCLIPWIEELIAAREKYLVNIIGNLWANPRGLDECWGRNLPINWEKLCHNSHPWAIEQIMFAKEFKP